MTLRLKVSLILLGMWVLISLSIILYSRYTLLEGYQRLEKHQVIDSIEQTKKTLDSLMSYAKLINGNWAEWDDAYRFMNDKDQTFINSNLEYTTFKNAKLNLILFYDAHGQFFYGKNYDLQKGQFVALPSDLLKQLESEKSYTMNEDTKGKLGILKSQNRYVVLSSMPILTSQGKGPSHGNLIMGYFFTNEQLAKLSDIINLKVTFYTLPLNKQSPSSITQALAALNNGAPYYITTLGHKNSIYGFTAIRNIDQNMIGMIRVTVPRTIYHQGVTTIEHYIAIILSIGILFLAAIWYLLKVFVLDRIINISDQIVEIHSHSDFAKRLPNQKHDELGRMTSAFNSLMEIIELTQEQLKYRIFQRTEELEELSRKNKNLFDEIDQQKNIENYLREQEKSLRTMAYYDALTGLPNRLFFNEIMSKTIKKSDHDGSNFAVLFIDIDKFKLINDTYGHDIGDKYLKHIAQLIRNSIKESDIAARLAGDEFIICLNNIKGKALVNKVAEKILEMITVPLIHDTYRISTTVSIGISLFPTDGDTIEELERHADLAMYYAKKRTGNAFAYFNETCVNTTTTA